MVIFIKKSLPYKVFWIENFAIVRVIMENRESINLGTALISVVNARCFNCPRGSVQVLTVIPPIFSTITAIPPVENLQEQILVPRCAVNPIDSQRIYQGLWEPFEIFIQAADE